MFTKNRSKGFDGLFSIYKIPNKEGSFVAKKVGEIKSCGNYRTCAITGAALNKEENEIALVTHDNVFILPFKGDDSFQQNQLKVHSLHHNTQKEAITYFADSNLLIVDEKKKDTDGGKVYRLKL